MMDLTKLTPAPWDSVETVLRDAFKIVLRGRNRFGGFDEIAECDIEADADFIALARNAFDVMMRRGWSPERFSLLGGGYAWRIPMSQANDMIRVNGANAADFKVFADLKHWPDPFTALVEADKWYAENVEKPAEVPA